MGTYAVFADVQARYEQTIPADRQAYVDLLIDEAEQELIRQVPNVAVRVALVSTDPNYLNPAVVKTVVVRAVLRTYSNPRGYANETDGQYGYGFSRQQLRAGAQIGGDISFSDSDLALLGVLPARARVGTIGLKTFAPLAAPPGTPL